MSVHGVREDGREFLEVDSAFFMLISSNNEVPKLLKLPIVASPLFKGTLRSHDTVGCYTTRGTTKVRWSFEE